MQSARIAELEEELRDARRTDPRIATLTADLDQVRAELADAKQAHADYRVEVEAAEALRNDAGLRKLNRRLNIAAWCVTVPVALLSFAGTTAVAWRTHAVTPWLAVLVPVAFEGTTALALMVRLWCQSTGRKCPRWITTAAFGFGSLAILINVAHAGHQVSGRAADALAKIIGGCVPLAVILAVELIGFVAKARKS